ncbi:MAG: hypothetical protein ACQESR_02715 [Planctomycetota bacterium]
MPSHYVLEMGHYRHQHAFYPVKGYLKTFRLIGVALQNRCKAVAQSPGTVR